MSRTLDRRQRAGSTYAPLHSPTTVGGEKPLAPIR